MIQLLAKLEPVPHTSSSNTFDMGYEQAKRDIALVLETTLGSSYRKSGMVELISRLRSD
jgi:hypothetical protein